MVYDCIVIGGGIIGAAVLDRLSAYRLSVLLLEKEDDVASFSTRANSGVVHAGYDCKPGTLKAKFNVRGNSLIWQDAAALNVPHKKCGSIVVADEDGSDGLKELAERAKANGVEAYILNREQTLEIEPNVSDRICYSLYAPSAGVVSPFRLAIAYVDRAVLRGAEVVLEAPVTGIKRVDGAYELTTSKCVYRCKCIINCAGQNGAQINDMAGAEHYVSQYRRGDYFVIDNTERDKVHTVIFPLPSSAGKGILVAPTPSGNVLYGPTAVDTVKDDVFWDDESLSSIRKNVPLTFKCPAFDKRIRVFSGLRTIIGDDFIVGASELIPDFIFAIGICSPGLTSAPAIAEYIEQIVVKKFRPDKKLCLVTAFPAPPSSEGEIVCRCEGVRESQVIAAIHSPVPAVSVDAVKRRTRAGMGRCQGAYCRAKVRAIIARELGIPESEVLPGKDIGVSQIDCEKCDET